MNERKIFLQPTADGRVRATTDVPTKNFPEVGKVDGGKLNLGAGTERVRAQVEQRSHLATRRRRRGDA